MRYLCSLGGNIDPQRHLALAVQALLELSPSLQLSRVIRTRPEGIDSSRYFLNALVALESSLDQVTLKQRFNAIEQALGRDRNHPMSSQRDRPIDIDILAVGNWPLDLTGCLADEPYLQPLARDFTPDQALPAAEAISIALTPQLSAGQRPATIDREPTTGDIRVVEQVVDRLADRFQSALSG